MTQYLSQQALAIAFVASALTLLGVGDTALAQGNGKGGQIIDDLAGAAKKGRAPSDTVRRKATAIGDIQPAVLNMCADQKGYRLANTDWRYNVAETRCISVRENMMTSIVFPEWEEIVDLNLGDNVGFDVRRQSKRPNVLLVTMAGQMAQADTSLTVFGRSLNNAATSENAPWGSVNGGRNVYSFIVTSHTSTDQDLTNVVVRVHANKPGAYSGIRDFSEVPSGLSVRRAKDDKTQKMRDGEGEKIDGQVGSDGQSGRPEWLRKIPFNVATLRFKDYRVRMEDGAQPESIAPERVFHDGVFTYLDFGEGDGSKADQMLRPVVLRVVDDIDSKVNTRTTGPTGNIMVIEAIGDFTLRNGSRVVCIDYVGPDIGAPGTERKTAQTGEAYVE